MSSIDLEEISCDEGMQARAEHTPLVACCDTTRLPSAGKYRCSVRGILQFIAALFAALALYEFVLVPLALRRTDVTTFRVRVTAPIVPVTVNVPHSRATLLLATNDTSNETAADTFASPFFSPRLRPYFLTDVRDDTPALPDTGRYIRVNVGGQFNNHRQATSIAALFALILGRTVIIPSYGPLATVLDIPSLARFVPVISEEEHARKIDALRKSAAGDRALKARLKEYDMDWVEWKDLYYLTRASYESDPAQQEYAKSHKRRPRFVLDEWDADPTARDAITMWGGPNWIFWRQDVAFPQNVMDDFEREFGHHMHFRVDLWQRAGIMLDWLAAMRVNSAGDAENTYGAIHWRQTDLPHRYQLSPDRICEIISSWGITSGGVVYIATDDPDSDKTTSLVYNLRKRGIIAVMYDSSPLAALDKVDALGASYQPFMEQLVLAHGAHFYHTMQSTYSGFIHRMRQWMDQPHAWEETAHFYRDRGYDANPALGVRPPTKDNPDFDIFENAKQKAKAIAKA